MSLDQNFEDVWRAHVEDDVVWSPEEAERGHRFTPDGPVHEPQLPAPEPAPAVAPRRPLNRFIAAAVAVALIAGVAGAGIAAGRRTNDDRPTLAAQPTPTIAPPTQLQLPPPASTATASAEDRRGVVEITTTLAFASGSGAGTGMILTPDGQVLTNNHVIEGTSSVSVQINGTGRTYKATVVGTDESHDVALLQLEGASGLTTIESTSSSTLSPGDAVTAIGNALGQAGPPTVANGTVVALNQSITAGDRGGQGEALDGLIQTDLPLLPGDSGGPLLNGTSQVVGMNTAASVNRRTQTGATEAYAIPIEQARAIVADIAAGRASSTIQIGPPAFLGVGLVTVTNETGAGVATVQAGTPAANAGIKPGDSIVAVDGKAIDSATTLRSVLGAHKPNDKVSIAWTDSSDQRHTATVTLAAGPPR